MFVNKNILGKYEYINVIYQKIYQRKYNHCFCKNKVLRHFYYFKYKTNFYSVNVY